MKYELPDPAKVMRQKRDKVAEVVITTEKDESLVELAVQIAYASFELCPLTGGPIDPRRNTKLLEEDLQELRLQAKSGTIQIDYWKCRPVKLYLQIKKGCIRISLNVWADRWDTNSSNAIPDFAVNNLGEVLAKASTLGEVWKRRRDLLKSNAAFFQKL